MWTALQVLGAFLVVAGVSFVYWPAGLIVGGVLVTVIGVLGEPT